MTRFGVMEHLRVLENVPGTGWMRALSGLKTLLETGEPLFG